MMVGGLHTFVYASLDLRVPESLAQVKVVGSGCKCKCIHV